LTCLPTTHPRAGWHPPASLRQALALRRCLKIPVGYVQIAVTQVVADHELVFAHVRQHGPDRVPKSPRR